MTALSITLPSRLATESKEAAERMGISRSEFIRLAVKHEVERHERELKLHSMVKKSLKPTLKTRRLRRIGYSGIMAQSVNRSPSSP